MAKPRLCLTIKQMADVAQEIADWLKWDGEMISDFHLYAQRWGCLPGSNVLRFALEEALRYRGMTLEQLRAEAAHDK